MCGMTNMTQKHHRHDIGEGKGHITARTRRIWGNRIKLTYFIQNKQAVEGKWIIEGRISNEDRKLTYQINNITNSCDIEVRYHGSGRRGSRRSECL